MLKDDDDATPTEGIVDFKLGHTKEDDFEFGMGMSKEDWDKEVAAEVAIQLKEEELEKANTEAT